jgi:hypothetical protein
MDIEGPTRTAVERTLDHELAMVTAAVALVAAGQTRRVVLAGLRFAEALLPDAKRIAGEMGVRAVPVYAPRSEGGDIAIEAGAAPEGAVAAEAREAAEAAKR